MALEAFSYGDGVRKTALGKKNERVWVNTTNITRDEAEQLKTTFGLHGLTAEDLVNTGIRVKVEEFPAYLFCVFYTLDKKGDTFEMDFVIGKDFLITNQKRTLSSVERLKEDSKKLDTLFAKGPEFVFHKILDEEVDNVFAVLETLDENVDRLEERAATDPQPSLLKDIYRMKRHLSSLKRTFLAQREKTSFLAKNTYPYISKRALPYFRDVYDHSVRVSDTVEDYREASANAFDVYMSAVSNNMNEVMKVLSIIATIALPLSVISGIYGTNFAVIPGSSAPHGFWLMILAMVLLCVGMISYFWRKKWL